MVDMVEAVDMVVVVAAEVAVEAVDTVEVVAAEVAVVGDMVEEVVAEVAVEVVDMVEAVVDGEITITTMEIMVMILCLSLGESIMVDDLLLMFPLIINFFEKILISSALFTNFVFKIVKTIINPHNFINISKLLIQR